MQSKEPFFTLTGFARLCGTTRTIIGRILTEQGLRIISKHPTLRAYEEGFVEQYDNIFIPGKYLYKWHLYKTLDVLLNSGLTIVKEYYYVL